MFALCCDRGYCTCYLHALGGNVSVYRAVVRLAGYPLVTQPGERRGASLGAFCFPTVSWRVYLPEPTSFYRLVDRDAARNRVCGFQGKLSTPGSGCLQRWYSVLQSHGSDGPLEAVRDSQSQTSRKPPGRAAFIILRHGSDTLRLPLLDVRQDRGVVRIPVDARDCTLRGDVCGGKRLCVAVSGDE